MFANTNLKSSNKELNFPNKESNFKKTTMRCSKSISKEEVYSNIGLLQDMRKISNKQSNSTFKGTRKRRTNDTQR